MSLDYNFTRDITFARDITFSNIAKSVESGYWKLVG